MDALCALRLPKGQSSLFSARCIEIIDCLQLPHNIVWHKIGTIDAAYEAIKSMKIRGAPAIASLAAVSIACELYNAIDAKSKPLSSSQSLLEWLKDRSEYLLSSRPTAVNLREAMHRLQDIATSNKTSDAHSTAQAIAEAAELVWTEDVQRNVRIGDNGAAWLIARLERSGAIQAGQKINVLTVCNTGSLATSVGCIVVSCISLNLIEHTVGIRDSAWRDQLSTQNAAACTCFLRADWTLPTRRPSNFS